MDYQIRIKKKSDTNYSVLDIFADTVVSFDLDFYDVENIDKIKVPISVDLTLPMNQNNLDIIGYDPSSSTNNTLPTDPFDLILSVNGNDVLSGNLYIESYSYNNNTPVIEVRIVDKIQDIFASSSNVELAEMYSDYDIDYTFDSFLSAYEGILNTGPGLNAIQFPYIDFANDLNKFNYAARQFIQFGYDKERVGIVPAFSVKEFINRLFNELNVGVSSKFFQIGNYGTPVPNVDPEYMYMMLPVRMQGFSRDNQRQFYLVEGPYNFYINDYTGDLDPTVSTAAESDAWPESTGSWNYNNVSTLSTVDTGYGIDAKLNLPNDYTNLSRAYFGSHMSYTGIPSSASRQLPNGSWIACDIPMLRISEENYAVVKDIDQASSNGEFIVKCILWVDGFPTEAFRMCNADGSVKTLSINDATIENSAGTTGLLASDGNSFDDIDDINSNLTYQVRFSDTVIGDFIWEQKEFEILAGSTYGMSIEVELISGNVRYEKVDTWTQGVVGLVPATTSFISGGSELIGKMVYREDLSNIGNLYLLMNGINGSFNPYFSDDNVNIYNSILFNTEDIKPSNVFREIIKRFNLSLVYDQNSDSVIIDRLPDIRSSNQDVDLEDRLDDAQGIDVDIVYKFAKSIEIKGLSGLHFDTFGYDTVTINQAGSDELRFDLDSRFYNQSVCGDTVFTTVPEGFNQYEIGLTTNEFTPLKDIGITFGYIDKPLYTTNIKRGKFVDKNDFKGIVYTTYRPQVFGGRFRTDRAGSIKLYHFDEFGNQTDLYDFFTGNDNITFYSKPKVRFNALLSEDYAYDIKNNYSKVTIPYVNSNGIIIKSVRGELYENGIYSDIEGIIL